MILYFTPSPLIVPTFTKWKREIRAGILFTESRFGPKKIPRALRMSLGCSAERTTRKISWKFAGFSYYILGPVYVVEIINYWCHRVVCVLLLTYNIWNVFCVMNIRFEYNYPPGNSNYDFTSYGIDSLSIVRKNKSPM